MPEWEELAATSAAVQNFHLMVTAQGAAGYWYTLAPRDSLGGLRVQWEVTQHQTTASVWHRPQASCMMSQTR
jgi:hypothetical protein